jgi:uncharacterized protein (UPF0332 family)
VNLKDLGQAGKIRRIQSSAEEVKEIVALADRDMHLAGFVISQDWDWAFSIVYNAILQISRAYMFSRGYRAASHEAHKNTFEFMSATLGKDQEKTVQYFDRMRQKRNRVIYETVGLVTGIEVKELLRLAKEYIEIVKLELKDYV